MVRRMLQWCTLGGALVLLALAAGAHSREMVARRQTVPLGTIA